MMILKFVEGSPHYIRLYKWNISQETCWYVSVYISDISVVDLYLDIILAYFAGVDVDADIMF